MKIWRVKPLRNYKMPTIVVYLRKCKDLRSCILSDIDISEWKSLVASL